MNKEFIEALDSLAKEKGISKDLLLEAIERALVSAYKSKYKDTKENIIVSINPKTGEIEFRSRKIVVEEVVDPATEVSLAEVLEFDPDYEIGEVVEYEESEESVQDLGRIAAQTAKQVVVQAIREIERGMIYDEYIERQGEIITGVIQRVSNETVFINLGRTEAIMSPGEQVRNERYTVNSRMKFYLMDVKKTQKGPQIFMSRSHPGLVKRLFELEVPEIMDGIVSIENLAREAGSRTKMTVSSSDESVDPVGACVGNRGARVQAVVDELFGEKIDIITWSEDIEENISNALSPAKVEKIVLDEEENAAIAIVPDYQLSLAIGKEGQNVRLAAKLCGMKIDIKSHSQYFTSSDDSLVGELDDEGYLNPADFVGNSSDDLEDEEIIVEETIEEVTAETEPVEEVESEEVDSKEVVEDVEEDVVSEEADDDTSKDESEGTE